MRPRDLVIPDQIIDKTFRRAATFFESAAVHVEFAEPFCPLMRRTLLEAAKTLEDGDWKTKDGAEQPPAGLSPSATLQPPSSSPFTVHGRGCYICMEGPAFSTRAESLMHRLWGGDLIGMTAMPEAKLAREAEMSYALVTLVTDYDSWRAPSAAGAATTIAQPAQPPLKPDAQSLLNEILANLKAAATNGMALVRKAVELIATYPSRVAGGPAQEALKLAVWSDKARVPRAEVERLALLWGRYFDRSPE